MAVKCKIKAPGLLNEKLYVACYLSFAVLSLKKKAMLR